MKPIDWFEKIIRDLHVLEINTSTEMDRRILHDTLKVQQECKTTKLAGTQPDIWRTIMKNPITKSAAVIAAVICVGAIAVVGVNIGKIYYWGKTDDGSHLIFYSEGGEGALGNGFITTDANGVTDVDQKVRDLEEMKILSQQGKKELLQVEITMVDDTLEMRMHEYKYELSDGRTTDMREGAGGAFALGKAQWQEWRQVKEAGPGEDLGTYEETVEGRVFSFKRQRYFLSDGTEVVFSIGQPQKDQ